MGLTAEHTLYARLKEIIAYSPTMYANARVALNFARFVARKPHEPDFSYLRSALSGREGVLLDVGANNGMSALSLRIMDRRSPIVSIEPNVLLESSLRRVGRVVGKFDYRITAAGAERSSFTLFTPVYRGMAITGEASLKRPVADDVVWLRRYVRRIDASKFTVHQQQVDVVPLDDLDLRPSFVKIDVEGAEAEVLVGMRGTLARHRPLVMVERSGSFAAVEQEMARSGYSAHTFEAGAQVLRPGVVGSPLNVFFVPTESDQNGTRIQNA